MSPGRNSGASRTRTRRAGPAGQAGQVDGVVAEVLHRVDGGGPPGRDPELLGPEQHVDVAAQLGPERHPPDGGVGQPGRGHPRGAGWRRPGRPATAREAGARYSSAGAACCTIRPASITATSSPTTNASSWSWVTNTAVTPRSASSRCTSARIWTRRMVSRLENGSSSSSTDGRVTSALASATRWAWPPDRLAGRRSPKPARSTRASASATRPAAPLGARQPVADVAGHAQVGEQGAVLEHHPDPPPLRGHEHPGADRTGRPGGPRRRRAAPARRCSAAGWSCRSRWGRAGPPPGRPGPRSPARSSTGRRPEGLGQALDGQRAGGSGIEACLNATARGQAIQP